MKQEVVRRIKAKAAEHGWTTGKLGIRIGMSQAAFSQMLNHTDTPKREVMEQIAQELGVTVKWLEYGDEGVTESIEVMLDEWAFEPIRAHEADAGLDLRMPMTQDETLFAHDSLIIDTGVHIAIPQGYVGMLKSKSGLNVKYGITSEGVIDSGYTGSIMVKLYNQSDNDHYIHMGDKISQLVILPCITPQVKIVDKLDETERGENGFGSTGR